jgi:hypothetical protein
MSLRAITSFLVIGAIGLGVSCKKEQDSAPPVHNENQSDGAYDEFEAPPMELHYLKANQVHDAVVMGNLDTAKATAQWIADNTVADQLPVKWRPNVPPVVDAANEVVGASDLETAAKGLASLGNACGKCHAAMEVPMEIPEKDPPPEADDAKSHMLRHQWAVRRMWDGLIAPSDDAWTAGAEALKEAPLTVESGTASEAKEGQGIADEVHGLGAAAVGQTLPDERAATYGELLYTCSKCHSGGG